MTHPRVNREHLSYVASLIVKAMEEKLYGKIEIRFKDGILIECWYNEGSLPPNPPKKNKKHFDSSKMTDNVTSI
jgi:hypothetical protein